MYNSCMPDVLAICDTCGAFFPSGIVAENAFEITFAGNIVGQCPRCGGIGHIPEGTYNFTQDTIELLQGPQATISELERLAQILQEARERNASVEEVRETIQQETPNLSKLSSVLPRTRNELYAFLAVVIAAIHLILSTASAQGVNIQDVDIDFNQVIGVTLEQQTHQPTTQPHAQKAPKIGRNELCPCGSGKKYKKCHGDPIREQRTSHPR